eukprot:NODE_79_length_23048_cov_0.747614.p6 type:complete len:535 gc:universal NODE_79_length_23048_cov_0.747614:17267-15663(-)
MPKLIIDKKEYVITKTIVLGRHPECAITLDHPSISQKHARIFIRGSSYYIEDLNSSNGVRVNEKKKQESILKDKDIIQLGAKILQYFDRRPSHGVHTDNVRLVKINVDTTGQRISAEIEPLEEDFAKLKPDADIETLKQDYEKLRLAYELSKVSFTTNTKKHYVNMLDLMFNVLPVDRGVILEIEGEDQLRASHVKIRQGHGEEGEEIILSSTILSRVFNSKKCLIAVDTSMDPDLGKAKSIAKANIRSVMCLPLIAHGKILGILHLDSKNRIKAFAEKDISLVRTIVNQTAVLIENSMFIKESQKEVRITEQLNRFLPPQMVQQMIHQNNPFNRGGELKMGTILFADIRGFTTLSETMSPAEIFELLNGFFERMVRVAFEFNGMIDKFIGDCIMCGFGLIEDDPLPELRAINAAIKMKKSVIEFNRERSMQNKNQISVGIGLNRGNVFFGVIGGSERVEVTSIGDTVNVGSRICDQAKDNEILITESVYRMVKNEISVKFHKEEILKGKSQSVRIYEVTDVRKDSISTLDLGK